MDDKNRNREERERELVDMLNDPARRPELEAMFLKIKNYTPKVGDSLIRTILEHEFGSTD